MDDDTFWELIGRLDWESSGDDDAVVQPLIDVLVSLGFSAIRGFEDRLSEKLYALDTEAHAREIGEKSYSDLDPHFSADWFLYARCCVVSNGLDFYQQVLGDSSKWPKNMEFEPLLYVAAEAYMCMTGKEFDYNAPTNYETFRNRTGWGAV